VLEYKNIPHEVVYVNLRNKPDWLFERNPTGRVPILEYKGHVIYESAVCNEYLEEAFPASPKHGPALLPSCPFERASARLLMLSFNKVTGYIFRFNFNSDPAMHQELRNSFHTDLQKFENLLAASKKPFFGGTNCGMADFHLWPFFERFDAISELSGNDILPAAKFPQLTAWKSLMETLDAVKKTQLSTAAHKHFLVTYRGGNPDYDFDVEKIGHGLPEAAHKVSKL
jgi:glutathione S-transferase